MHSKSMWKEKGKSKLKSKEKGKRKGKEKGKSKNKSKEGTSDTSNTKCFFCKGKDCPKSLRWPAEKKTMSHELSKLTMRSRCTTGDWRAPAEVKVLGFYDISGAHFHSPALRTTVIKAT